MPSMLRLVLATMLLTGCAPAACDAQDEKMIAREVEILIGEAGSGAREAESRLVARGAQAIAILETGLYQADALGRQRIVKTLEKIGDPEVVAVLEHLAERDPDADVRDRAKLALSRLSE
jgi:hypothetical protein